MVSNKFRRSQERKERKEAEKFKKHQKDNIAKPKPKRKKWRVLRNNGSFDGIAFGSDYKIGNGGIIGLSCVGAIVIFFAMGLTLYPIQQEDTGGMEMCANAFCEWFDILTGADEYGAKQTPKEQVPESDRDFLPPSEFLIPFAEARSDDEPVCYSQACKRNHAETQAHFDDEDMQAKSLNEQIVDTKFKIEKTKDVIKIIEEKIREFKLDIPQLELDLLLMEKDLEDQQELVKEMRYEYDRMRYNYVDNDELFEFEEEYKQERNELDDMQFNYDKLENDIIRDNELLEKEEEMLKLAEIDLLMFMDDLTELKIQLHKIHRAGNLFAIRLSETCNTLIEQGMNEREVAVDVRDNWVYETKTEQICPTYRDLRDTFDNTLEPISGEFIDHGYDIRRDVSGYKEYWRYYYNLPNWKVITVDPDVDMMHRAMIIEIQASTFTFPADNQGQLNLARYDNGTMSERGYIYYKNVSINDECRHANVAPDMELVGKVLQHFMNECEDNLDYQRENIVTIPYISFDKMDSQWYQYISWLNNAIKEYGH